MNLSEKYWRLIFWATIVLGIATLIPINVGVLNHLGYYSLCGSAPISTIAMFVMAMIFYSYWKKKERLFIYVGVAILLVISGFLTYWGYTYKLPLASLDAKLTIDHVWSGFDEHLYERNVSAIFFRINFTNPTSTDACFRIEDFDYFINNTKIKRGTYQDDLSSWARSSRESYIHGSSPIKVNAHQTVSTDIFHLIVIENLTETEQGTFEPSWLFLMQQNFTFSIKGITVERWSYTQIDYMLPIDYSLVIVANPIALSTARHQIF